MSDLLVVYGIDQTGLFENARIHCEIERLML